MMQRTHEKKIIRPPRGQYCTVTVWEHLAFVAGHVSRTGDGLPIRGCLVDADDIPRGRDAACAAANACLDALEHQLTTLDAVARILSVRGFLVAAPTFEHHSHVLDAASERIIDMFGERGQHARAVVGVTSLPSGGIVEIEMLAALRTR